MSQLQTNLTNLQIILDKVNALSGMNMETCTVTFSGTSSNFYPTNIAYVSLDNNGNICYKNETCSTDSITVTCLKNTIVTVNFKSFNSTSSNLISSLFHTSTTAVFGVDSDFVYQNDLHSEGGSN